ncbi:unnamed protein product, partial [Staurois parvus]
MSLFKFRAALGNIKISSPHSRRDHNTDQHPPPLQREPDIDQQHPSPLLPPERAFHYHCPPYTGNPPPHPGKREDTHLHNSGHFWDQESGSAYTIKQPAASFRSHLVPMLRASLLSGKNAAAPL